MGPSMPTCCVWVMTTRTRFATPDRVPPVPAPEPRDAISDWLHCEDLRRAVASLPHDQRVAVILHFHLDLPLSEVAVALGISQAGVKSRINRALKRLRPAMGAARVNV